MLQAAALGFVEIIKVVDHKAGKDQGDDEAAEDGDQGPADLA